MTKKTSTCKVKLFHSIRSKNSSYIHNRSILTNNSNSNS